jgi:hypothetical protein
MPFGCVFQAFLKGDFILNKEYIAKLDTNNTKALSVASLALQVIENGLGDIDPTPFFEVICDYLKCNDRIFDERM